MPQVTATARATDAGTVLAVEASASGSEVELPPANEAFDYQLGGAYAPARGVRIVTRDRTETPEKGLYNICYVNGFQVQPGEEDTWDPNLLLRDEQGNLVIDKDWDEVLLDTGSAAKRSQLAQVVGAWIRQCAQAGFNAVEIDNLDSFTRSFGALTQADAIDLMARFSKTAHAEGLAIAQKNAAELVARKGDLGTDFAVTEECNVYAECDSYTAGYGSHVLMIEYDQAAFSRGCSAYGADYSLVLRDLDLSTPTSKTYVYQGC